MKSIVITGKNNFTVKEVELIMEQLEDGISEKYEINASDYLAEQYTNAYYAHGENGDQVKVYVRHEWGN